MFLSRQLGTICRGILCECLTLLHSHRSDTTIYPVASFVGNAESGCAHLQGTLTLATQVTHFQILVFLLFFFPFKLLFVRKYLAVYRVEMNGALA